MNKTRKMAKRVAFRVLKTASSSLPSDPVHYLGDQKSTGFDLKHEEESAEVDEEKFDDESIHDVEFADDRAKHQDSRRDEKDFTNLQLQYNKPTVPDNVRR